MKSTNDAKNILLDALALIKYAQEKHGTNKDTAAVLIMAVCIDAANAGVDKVMFAEVMSRGHTVAAKLIEDGLNHMKQIGKSV